MQNKNIIPEYIFKYSFFTIYGIAYIIYLVFIKIK